MDTIGSEKQPTKWQNWLHLSTKPDLKYFNEALRNALSVGIGGAIGGYGIFRDGAAWFEVIGAIFLTVSIVFLFVSNTVQMFGVLSNFVKEKISNKIIAACIAFFLCVGAIYGNFVIFSLTSSVQVNSLTQTKLSKQNPGATTHQQLP
jgi:hypothetical protein